MNFICRIAFCGFLSAATVMNASEPLDSICYHYNWTEHGVQAGAAFVFNAGLTEVLKHSVTERRPDGSGDDSFPSRHTSWAYNLGAIGAHELYRFSPWTVTGFHVLASAVGVQRVLALRHRPVDVLSGAVIGVGSAELGYWLGGLLFRDNREQIQFMDYESMSGLDYATVALFPLSDLGAGYSSNIGISYKVRALCPLSDRWGVLAALRFMSLPVYRSGRFMGLFNAFGLSSGFSYGGVLHGRWGFQSSIGFGVSRVWGKGDYRCGRWTFDADVELSLPCSINDKLTLGPRAGYSMLILSKPISMLTLSMFTQVSF